jgi:hypothetical protein
MEIKKSIKNKDGTVVFKGTLSPEEHDFVLSVGLNTLVEQGVLAMTAEEEINLEEDEVDWIPGETPVQ